MISEKLTYDRSLFYVLQIELLDLRVNLFFEIT